MIGDEIVPGGDNLVVGIVMHLFESGQANFLHHATNLKDER